MPGMHGSAVAKEMGNDPLLCKIPIMFITTHMFQKEARNHEVVKAGKRFLAKSNDAEALVASVGRLVRGDQSPLPVHGAPQRAD
jgi:CheY-like chemotaxis protein